MPATLRRCLYCGSPPVETERPRERHLVCPGCKGAMSEVAAGALMIDHCVACGGVWYDRGELDQAIEAEKQKKQELWEHLPGGDPQRDTKVVYRSCPICRQAMLRKLKKRVVIDVCGAHGAFLDAGELEAIAQHKEVVQPEAKPKARVPRTAGYDAELAEGVEAATFAAELIMLVLLD